MTSADDQERNNSGSLDQKAAKGNDKDMTNTTSSQGTPRQDQHSTLHPELEWKEQMRGHQPGNRYVRFVRPHTRKFKRKAPGRIEATERVLAPSDAPGRMAELVRRILIGGRLRSELEAQERTNKVKGLAIFASDNMSSSAYATEEVMRVLALAGVGALALTIPITLVIVFVLVAVILSYLQVIHAYPRGGGSYVVAHENLGPLAGLAAASALTTDYILTVAVSTSAGVAAITSAFPELFAQRVIISVAVVGLVMLINLRGIRESGTMFAAPTYLYLISILGLLAYGFFRTATGNLPPFAPPVGLIEQHAAEPLALLLILRAFASGSVALTGVEAVSDGVAAFKPPEVRNAQIILVTMGGLFATIFLGISFLSAQIGIIPSPDESETVISQMVRLLVGNGWYYYLVQFATAIVLVLAANTAFNGFPRLAVIVAQDRYLPTQFQFRGDRLAFTVGVVLLGLVSAVVIVIFEGSVTGLIPLYTVGVFLAFTLSQAGLVRRWIRLKDIERGWKWRASVNVVGTFATGIVLVVVAVSKFALGAWMVLLLIPFLMFIMWGINRHYRHYEEAMSLERSDLPLPRPHEPKVVVPVSKLDRAALQALAYAQSISNDVTAVHISDDPESAEQLQDRWQTSGCQVPLVVVESPYRALIQPLLAYIDAVDSQDPHRPLTVVLSQFVPNHFWEWILHNQTSLRLKVHLFFRRNTIVVDVPYRTDT